MVKSTVWAPVMTTGDAVTTDLVRLFNTTVATGLGEPSNWLQKTGAAATSSKRWRQGTAGVADPHDGQ